MEYFMTFHIFHINPLYMSGNVYQAETNLGELEVACFQPQGAGGQSRCSAVWCLMLVRNLSLGVAAWRDGFFWGL